MSRGPAHIKRTRVLDEADAITGNALPRTPDDGPADPLRVRAALEHLARLQARMRPGSDEWQAVADAAESLVPSLDKIS